MQFYSLGEIHSVPFKCYGSFIFSGISAFPIGISLDQSKQHFLIFNLNFNFDNWYNALLACPNTQLHFLDIFASVGNSLLRLDTLDSQNGSGD